MRCVVVLVGGAGHPAEGPRIGSHRVGEEDAPARAEVVVQVEGALGRAGLEVGRDVVDAQDLLRRSRRGAHRAAGSSEGSFQIVDLVEKGRDDLVGNLQRARTR